MGLDARGRARRERKVAVRLRARTDELAEIMTL
ncbi:hypothetical protein BH24ACT24_BH24ACT24_02700 [soil metagenome]|jgi:hypothetical protein